MGKRIDLSNKRFGKLIAIDIKERIDDKDFWNCICDCGKLCIKVAANLRAGDTKSCGCLIRDSKINNQHAKRFNKYCNLSNGTTIVELTRGQWCILDTEDWEKIKYIKWCAVFNKSTDSYYVNSNNNKRMHRLIVDCPDNLEVDHINHDTLNNIKNNLRIVNRSQNMINKGIYKNNSSGFAGVEWRSDNQKWRARINVGNIKIPLGHFENKVDAIKARQEAELKYFGEYRYVN